MYICMYAYMYICMYAYMYICTYAYRKGAENNGNNDTGNKVE
jgi:hypothetical protein